MNGLSCNAWRTRRWWHPSWRVQRAAAWIVRAWCIVDWLLLVPLALYLAERAP